MVRTADSPQTVRATTHVVGPDYFSDDGTLADRRSSPDGSDREAAGRAGGHQPELADTLWPAQNPLGKTMTLRALTFRGPSDVETEVLKSSVVMPNAFVFGFNPERPDARPEHDLHGGAASACRTSGRDPAVRRDHLLLAPRERRPGIGGCGAWTRAPRNRPSPSDRIDSDDGGPTRRRDVQARIIAQAVCSSSR